MQLKKKIIYSALVSAGLSFLSIISTITPCRVAPAVPNPIYKWKLCTLNPDQISSLNSIKEYFGYTSSITDALLITIIFSLVIIFLILHFFSGKKNK
ncbi:MAG: hypothetical protein WC548_03415 [Candidatus Pacearchaeota archaeon]